MKKLVLLTVMLTAMAGLGFAQTPYAGAFGFGLELTGVGTLAFNNGQATLYAVDNSGTSRLLPVGSPATLSTAWTGASTSAAPTFNLGTFYTGDSLTLDGASFLTFKGNGANVSATFLNYRITPGVGGSGAYLPGVSLNFNQDNVDGNTGDQRWANEAATTGYTPVNLLAGLAPGTYTLSFYGAANATSGNFFESNGGADFAATFTVVPEPSTWALMFGGLGMLVVFNRLRSRFVC